MGQASICQTNYAALGGFHDVVEVQSESLFFTTLCSDGQECRTNLDGNRFPAPKTGNMWFNDSFLTVCNGTSHQSSYPILSRARLKLFAPQQRNSFRNLYKLGKKLGDGASAEVFEAEMLSVEGTFGRTVHRDSSQEFVPRRVAVKVFKTADGTDSASNAIRGNEDFFRIEWEMLAQIEHPHVVRMYECFKDESALYIVMELCFGGELIEYVKDESRRRQLAGLDEKNARIIFRQMLYACSYLHAHRIVHRDIKLENFLLVVSAQKSTALVIKLCDFGTAVLLSDQMPRVFGRIGTLSYTSPEVCADRGATVLSDAWSLGVVLYVLLVGAKPFKTRMEEPKEETMRRIACGNYNQARPTWKTASMESKDLVNCLVTVEESQRLHSADALEHPWILLDSPTISLTYHWTEAAGATNNPLELLAHASHLEPLQRIVFSNCSQLIPESDIIPKDVWTCWYNLFFTLDTNKDGRIDATELAQGMWPVLGSSAQTPDAQIQAIIKALDLNETGALEWSEWIAVGLFAVGGLALEDELLATVIRRLGMAAEDEDAQLPTETIEDFSGHFLSQRIRSPPSPARILQLRQLFAGWTSRSTALKDLPKEETNENGGETVCLADLREILEGTCWFYADDDSWPAAGVDHDGLFAPSQVLNLHDSNGRLESTEQSMCLITGPSYKPSALCVLDRNHSCSAPNSPRGSNPDDSDEPLPDTENIT